MDFNNNTYDFSNMFNVEERQLNLEPTKQLGSSTAGLGAKDISKPKASSSISGVEKLASIWSSIAEAFSDNPDDLVDPYEKGRDQAGEVYSKYDILEPIEGPAKARRIGGLTTKNLPMPVDAPVGRQRFSIFPEAAEEVVAEEVIEEVVEDVVEDKVDDGLMSRQVTPEERAALSKISDDDIGDGLMSSPRPKDRPSSVAANVDFDFIKQREGYETKMYLPVDSKGKVLGRSGPTIASGFDLGQRKESDLKGLPLALVTKLKPYLGKTGASAKTYVKTNPLTLTSKEIDLINKFAKKQEVDRLKKAWENSTSSVAFDDLTKEQATVVASVAFQYGNLSTKTPKFWKYVTDGNWVKAEAELRSFGDKYPTRRTAEADFLAGN